MYIWKVDPLIEDLKNNNVSQNEQFKYLIATIVLTALGSDPILYVGSNYSTNDSISTLIMLLASILGLWLLVRANTDGKDLILRFCTLGLPIGVRFFAWFLPACLVLGDIEGYYGIGMSVDEAGNYIIETTIYQAIAFGLGLAIYYWRISVAITKVCATNA